MDSTDLAAVWLTLKLATVVTLLLLVVGTPIAWWLARTRSAFKGMVGAIVALPLVLPPTVLGFYLLVAFGQHSVIGELYRGLTGRSLVFTSDRGGSPQIYRMPAEGGPAQRLTFEGTYNVRPRFSPDGKSIAFVQRESGKFRIAVLEVDTGQVTVLTDGTLDDSPTYAPNGKMILYEAQENGRGQLAAVSSDGRLRGDWRRRHFPGLLRGLQLLIDLILRPLSDRLVKVFYRFQMCQGQIPDMQRPAGPRTGHAAVQRTSAL